MEYNIYCDESCHLEQNRHSVVVIGGMWNDFVPDEIVIIEGKE